MGLVAASVVVAAAGWIGHTLAGRRGTAWAALAAAALVANPMIGTTEINAELLGAPLTLLSVGFLLAGVRPPVRRPLGWRRTSQVALAGASGAAAVLVKQNLLDALVFGAALALAAALAGRWPWARSRTVLAVGLLGALLPIGLTVSLGRDRGPGSGATVGDALRVPRRRLARDRQRGLAGQRRAAADARLAVGGLGHRRRRGRRQRDPVAAVAGPRPARRRHGARWSAGRSSASWAAGATGRTTSSACCPAWCSSSPSRPPAAPGSAGPAWPRSRSRSLPPCSRRACRPARHGPGGPSRQDRRGRYLAPRRLDRRRHRHRALRERRPPADRPPAARHRPALEPAHAGPRPAAPPAEPAAQRPAPTDVGRPVVPARHLGPGPGAPGAGHADACATAS